jgi:2-iminobutanoate/2-iminopropanoate deaminase
VQGSFHSSRRFRNVFPLPCRRTWRTLSSSCVLREERIGAIYIPATIGGAFVPRDIIRTTAAPAAPPTYSQAVRAAGLIFVSGTGPFDPVTGKIAGETIQEQTGQCLRNIRAILEAAGTSLDRIVSATVIILEESDFAGMNEEWLKWFPADPPARQGAKLPVRIPGMKVSIAVIAEA